MKMNEASQEQEFQENLSGMADYEEWIYSMEQSSNKLIEDQQNDKRRNIPETQTPF